MIFSEPLEAVVRRRRSVRTYEKTPITQDVKDQIVRYMETLTNPFPAKPSFRIIEKELEPNGAKLGTYGMIRGASVFIASSVDNTPFAVEALGYAFEQLILYLTTLRLGTCWLGGSFNREEFRKALDSAGDALFPAISPIGYFERKSFRETMVRGFVRADSRKPWETLFFNGDFAKPLTEAAAGDDALLLEMVRLGPSASNKQPWRVVRAGNAFHFYEHKIPGYSGSFNFDMQGIDMGIAACHFHLAALEKGRAGHFDLSADPGLKTPENVIYKFTWVFD
ncbi:Nitroreductase family [Sporobacter termitidis DSM 10068]|uniref:Nitroreductase family n=1 Tax=Sporobacter termitidis DSM 10068 TaxID=1123282 RepID=A0A1M5ZGV0_9FIRM|nr:nitroreductase family protein [Sporobacter termitidis]SHI23486.1 Nitroreductase family [Sporobacter termitidis DSM 10068]